MIRVPERLQPKHMLSDYCHIVKNEMIQNIVPVIFTVRQVYFDRNTNILYTLPFKSLGSLRNDFIFQRKALFFNKDNIKLI